MSLLQCPRCLIPLSVGVCPHCLVDSVVEETTPLTDEQKQAVKKQVAAHVRYLEYRDRQLLRARVITQETAAAARSEQELRNAKDVLEWAKFHLSRAGYPESMIHQVTRLMVSIEARQRIDAERFKKVEAV